MTLLLNCKMGISRQAIHKWSLAFGWKERCNVREKDINKGIDEKFVAGVVDKKAKMLEELDKLDLMVDQEVITAFTQDPSTNKYTPKFKIERLKDSRLKRGEDKISLSSIFNLKQTYPYSIIIK